MILFKQETDYGLVEVIQTKQHRMLVLDGACQGYSDLNSLNLSESNYARCMTFAHDLFPQARRVVNIGCGPGFLQSMLEPSGLEFETIEINPVIVEVAKKFFSYAPKIEPRIADMRDISLVDRSYDIIFLDAYRGLNKEQDLYSSFKLENYGNALVNDGVLAMNVVTKLGTEKDSWLSVAMDANYWFNYVNAFLVDSVEGDETNVVIFCHNKQKPDFHLNRFKREKLSMLHHGLSWRYQ